VGSTFLDEALSYHARGWSIIPIREKQPLIDFWKPFQKRQADPETLRKLFSRRGISGLAVIHGDVSGGLVIRDYDREDAYQQWAGAYKDLAATLPTAQTGRGKHVFFRGPAQYAELDDGEYRGDSGHYTLLPPSKHYNPDGKPSGKFYRWLNPPGDELPVIADPVAVGLLPEGCNTENTGGWGGARGVSEFSGFSVLHGETLPSVLQDERVEQAILRTLPTRPGQRHRKVFELARELKALPHLFDADPASLEPVVRHWHALALPVITTKPFEETFIDFLLGWDKVKFVSGEGPLDVAFARCRDRVPEVALRYDQLEFRDLVCLCAELQRMAGARPFYLACRSAGRVLGVSHVRAWRWLGLLQVQKVLRLATKGEYETKKASEYYFEG
jgi:hypothetical protein